MTPDRKKKFQSLAEAIPLFHLFISPYSLIMYVKSESVSHSVVSDSCDPIDCSPPGSSAHGIFQARILEWVAIPFSRGSSCPGIELGSTALQVDSFTI